MDWTGIKVKTAPSVEPVTVAELKTFLSLIGTDFDSMLTGLISACRAAVESYVGRTMTSTTYELYFDFFPEIIELARPPVQSVSSIYYINSSGVDTLLATSLYRTDLVSLCGRIEPAYGETWPITREISNAVKVTFVAGYGAAASDVPDALRTVVKMLAADIFEHREANVEVTLNENRALKFLLQAYRIPVIV